MSASFTVRNNAAERTIYVRMTGAFDETAMQAFATDYKRATDEYRGGAHLVLADMRGMKPTSPDAATVLGEAIGYARGRGVACCAHLSDSTIQRLQARRVARSSSPGDDVTIDVASEDEAKRVLAEQREDLVRRSSRPPK